MERESLDFDIVIVGAGPAGLSAAIRLKQLNDDLNIVVLEKGSEVGAHILSGAVFETRALDELFPDWKELGAPLNTPVSEDQVFLFKNAQSAQRIPNVLVPKTMHNDGNYIISLGNLCRWLAEQAEGMGIEIIPGFAAAKMLYGDNGEVIGVITDDKGISKEGVEKDSFEPGMEIRGKYTLLSEGCRGHLGKELIAKFKLDEGCDPQHYGLGIKEIWEVDAAKHQPGLVVHGAGWPLSENGALGGSFLYHTDNNQVVVGLITDLNYENPYLSPYEEFQRFKTHPKVIKYLESGKRISYGARAIAKGGLNSLPQQHFPGGLLLGCDAGTLNFAKIKGIHTAMKSGLLSAEVIAKVWNPDEQAGAADLSSYADSFKNSWLYEELRDAKNFGAALHKYGTLLGGAFNFIDQNLFKIPVTLHDLDADYSRIKPQSEFDPIVYSKPDGTISFDRLSSVFLSSTNHEEDQPVHLTLKDITVPVTINHQKYAGLEQRYCPAGVYEFIEEEGEFKLQINAQNCLHCKTCDIKDPSQNITWVTPEGTGGPNYPNM